MPVLELSKASRYTVDLPQTSSGFHLSGLQESNSQEWLKLLLSPEKKFLHEKGTVAKSFLDLVECVIANI